MSQYNPNAMHHGHILRVNNQMLAEKQTITATVTVGNGKPVMADRTQGSMSVVVQASKDGNIDANETIVVQLMQDKNFDMAAATDVPVMFNKTFAASTPVTAGMVLGVLPIAEDVGPYIRGYLSGTSDVEVDLVVAYVPR